MSTFPESSEDTRTPKNPPISPDVEQRINDAIRILREAAECSYSAAVELNSIIITQRKSLASESELLRSAAELLHHMTQQFARTAALTRTTAKSND